MAFGIPEDRIHEVPNTLDCERFRPPTSAERAAARARFDVDGRVVILFVGRLTPQKAPELLLDAFESVAKTNPDALLVVLGDGPLAESVRAKADDNLPRDRYRLLGNCEDPLPWYHAADLYVSSSAIEGLSNSLMEALGCGLPVICTRVSGSEDLVDESIGRLVAPGDVEGLAAALRDWSADEARRAGAKERAREIAVSRFSSDAVVRSVLSVYRAVGASRS